MCLNRMEALWPLWHRSWVHTAVPESSAAVCGTCKTSKLAVAVPPGRA